jgi:Outer membrane protein beta-barrel domain
MFNRVWISAWVWMAFSLLVFIAQAAYGQSRFTPKRQPKPGKTPQADVINLPNYDSRKFHFGFFLALNYGGFRARHSDFFKQQLLDTVPNPDKFVSVNPVPSTGFTTGFIVSMRLNEVTELRMHPAVSFYQRAVEYRYADTAKKPSLELSQSTFSFVEIPILVKYKSTRRKNTRMFIVGGLKPGFEVGSKRKEISPDNLRTTSVDVQVDYGFGVDMYYPLFKFSPEIRFSHGLLNMAYDDDNIFRRSLGRLYTHTVTLYLNFN